MSEPSRGIDHFDPDSPTWVVPYLTGGIAYVIGVAWALPAIVRAMASLDSSSLVRQVVLAVGGCTFAAGAAVGLLILNLLGRRAQRRSRL